MKIFNLNNDEKYQVLSEAIGKGILFTDEKGIIFDCNKHSCSFFNFDDIRLDIDLDALKEEKSSIWDWYWSNIDSEQMINYYSYLKGLRIQNING